MFQITTLGSPDAQRAITAIHTELSRLNKSAAIAVVDAAGDLIAFLRLDGTPATCVTNATRKAYTAVKEAKPSRDIGRAVRNPTTGFDIAYFPDPRYIGWGGGLPFFVNGKAVGAIGVSGLSEDEDIHLAELGLQAILEDEP